MASQKLADSDIKMAGLQKVGTVSLEEPCVHCAVVPVHTVDAFSLRCGFVSCQVLEEYRPLLRVP
jgi:hypothetical protein